MREKLIELGRLLQENQYWTESKLKVEASLLRYMREHTADLRSFDESIAANTIRAGELAKELGVDLG